MLQREPAAAVLHRVCKACLQRCSVQRASAGARLQGALQPKTNLLCLIASVLQTASSVARFCSVLLGFVEISTS